MEAVLSESESEELDLAADVMMVLGRPPKEILGTPRTGTEDRSARS